jgi:peptide/nickel transport system substrate-binding protein
MREETMRSLGYGVFAAALAVLAGFALASPACAQTLTMALAAAPTSVDPHYHTFTPNESLDAHIFDVLVDMDAKTRPIPALAESWKLIADDTWEFHLRRGVTFHNGAPFTAADVAYTLARVPTVPNSPGSFAIYTQTVTGVEIPDPYTIRLKTKGIYPLLPIDLSQVFIIPQGLGPNPRTEDFNAGKDAIGTGPFRMVSYRAGEQVELERNDAWWGRKATWQHVTVRMIPNDAARTAALLAGDIQFMEFLPTADAARLRTDSRVALATTDSLRFVFLWLDHSRAGPPVFITGPNGEKLDHNPLRDVRVREALSLAINRRAIVERVMEGAALATGQFLAPGSYSYVPNLPPPPYDPERAKKLLAEAGYPKGFRITLHGPNDRYVNDARIIQSIGQMWSRIGVQTEVDAMTWSNFVGRANRQEFAAYLLAWGISSGEASNPLRSMIYTYTPAKGWGAVNRGRYSNPAIDALTDRAMTTADDAAREQLLIQAERLTFADVAVIPLHLQKNIWAMKAGLTYVARADEETRAADVRPAH